MARDRGPGHRTKHEKARRDSLDLQQSLPGGRVARRALRRLLERQEAYKPFESKPGYHKPGSLKGHV